MKKKTSLIAFPLLFVAMCVFPPVLALANTVDSVGASAKSISEYVSPFVTLMNVMVVPAFTFILALQKKVDTLRAEVTTLKETAVIRDASAKSNLEALSANINAVLRSLERITDRIDKLSERRD